MYKIFSWTEVSSALWLEKRFSLVLVMPGMFLYLMMECKMGLVSNYHILNVDLLFTGKNAYFAM